MTQPDLNKQIPVVKPSRDQLIPVSAYEQAQAQQLVAQVVIDSALPQPQARWLGQRLWQQMQQNRFNLSQLRQWLQQKQESLSHLFRYLRPRLHLWRQGGLALGLATGLTLSSLSQPLLALAKEPVGAEFRVNTTTFGLQIDPSIGVAANGDFVITWEDALRFGDNPNIYARRYRADGSPQSDEFLVNTTTTNDQYQPSIAVADNGDFVIAWQSFVRDDDKNGIYAQRYNADGIPQGSEFKVNTITNVNSDSKVAMAADGDFVITWYNRNVSGSYGIYARRYEANGIPQGNEFQINTSNTTRALITPSIAMAADGDFVISWSNYSGKDIYARRYEATATPQGSEFRVNTTTTNTQSFSSVAMADKGDFVITWQSFGQDSDGFGIYAQRYNAAGTPQGNEFQVNTFTTGSQANPHVALAADGDFVITWSSDNQDDNTWGVYAQRYEADGTPQGGEFRVNTTITDDQVDSKVGLADDGDFVIAWHSSNQDRDDYDVYAQRFGNVSSVYLPLVVK